MMKRITLIVLALALVLALAGCGCDHEWLSATCTSPAACSLCGETEGAPTGHSWLAATCSAPKTCETCGATDGEALPHTWIAATCETPNTCSVCGATDGDALGHSWLDATYDAPKTCETCGATDGEPVQRIDDFTQSASFSTIRELIDDSMSSFDPEYEYDSESQILYISLTAPDGTVAALSTNPDSVRDSWDSIVSGMQTISSSACTIFAADGYEDVSCYIMLLNDQNPDNVILGVLDGVVIYDVMAE